MPALTWGFYPILLRHALKHAVASIGAAINGSRQWTCEVCLPCNCAAACGFQEIGGTLDLDERGESGFLLRRKNYKTTNHFGLQEVHAGKKIAWVTLLIRTCPWSTTHWLVQCRVLLSSVSCLTHNWATPSRHRRDNSLSHQITRMVVSLWRLCFSTSRRIFLTNEWDVTAAIASFPFGCKSVPETPITT